MNANSAQANVEALATEECRRNPYPIYQGLRDHSPIYAEFHQAYLITRYDQCTKALSGKSFGRPDTRWFDRRIPQWRDYPSLLRASRVMQFSDPETHARLRGTVTRYFTARKVNSLIKFESHVVDRLLDAVSEQLEDGGTVDLQSTVSDRISDITLAAVLGVPDSELRQFRRYSLASTVMEPGLTTADVGKIDDSYNALGTYFDSVIADRRRNPRDDLATHFVWCCTVEESIAPEELMPMFAGLYQAGTINTSNFISNGIAALLNAPSEANLLRSNPGLADAAVTEILRYDAPMQVTRRIALTDTELGGIDFPVDTEIAVALGAANRDPDVFDDPDVFRIGRAGPAPLSFGGGPFFCIGAALSRLEGALVFQKLLSRFPALRIAEGVQHNMHFVLRGYVHLPVTIA